MSDKIIIKYEDDTPSLPPHYYHDVPPGWCFEFAEPGFPAGPQLKLGGFGSYVYLCEDRGKMDPHYVPADLNPAVGIIGPLVRVTIKRVVLDEGEHVQVTTE